MARILTVDDSPVMRQMVKATLAEAGHVVTQAANGEEALRIAATQVFDMVITDINMPVMDGLKFLEQRRTEGLAPGVPVVMITTEGSQSLVLGAIAAGAKGYICKPFTADQIKQRVVPLMHAA